MNIKNQILVGAMAMIICNASAQVASSSPIVSGSQAKPVFDGVTLYERVSRDELNRLSIIDGRIKRMHFKTEEMDVTKDDVNGQAFFTPKTDKTISVFVTTQRGATFTMVLQPVPKMPAVNLMVQETQATPSAGAPGQQVQKEATLGVLSAMNYEQAISTLIYAAATSQSLPGVSEQSVNQSIPLWQGTSFTHVRTLQAAGMRLGEYRLANVSKSPIRLVEQELYKPGVLAIAVEQHVLDPGEATPVFIVMEDQR